MRVASLAHAISRNSQRDYSNWLMRIVALANTNSRIKKASHKAFHPWLAIIIIHLMILYKTQH